MMSVMSAECKTLALLGRWQQGGGDNHQLPRIDPNRAEGLDSLSDPFAPGGRAMRKVTMCCVSSGLLACLLLVVSASDGQPPPDSGTKGPLPVPDLLLPREPAAPQPQSIDQILNGIADVRAKKAELEKQEQALMKVLRERVKEQRERMAKLGISLDEPPAKVEVKGEPPPKLDLPPIEPAPKEPGSSDVVSWRPEALDLLRRLGFGGMVLVPERIDWSVKFDYVDQVEWEYTGLEGCSVIAFWVPRDLTALLGFTTNVEFGRYVGSVRCVYGRPDGAPHTRCLDWLYERITRKRPEATLAATLMAPMRHLSEDVGAR